MTEFDADNAENAKVLLIVPDDKYLQSANASEFDVSEWKDKAIKCGFLEMNLYIDLSKQISNKYLDYDGFVISDSVSTIPYTSSYLSFMFEKLAKLCHIRVH